MKKSEPILDSVEVNYWIKKIYKQGMVNSDSTINTKSDKIQLKGEFLRFRTC